MAGGMPSALGLQKCQPGRQVISLAGDGGFAMLLGDLLTTVQENLAIKIAVYDNGKLGFVDIEQKAAGLDPVYTDLKNPDFGEVAKAMGIWGRSVSKAGDLEESIQTWLAQPGPALLHMKVKPMIAGLSISILWSFLKVLLWAAIIAVATWPLYRRFARHMPSSMASNVTPLLFTVLVALVVLGPPVFAFGTLAAHARTWVDTMLADSNEFVASDWLSTVPVVGPNLVEHFHTHGGLSAWVQRVDTAEVLRWLQSVGEFAGRHLFRIAFTVLLPFFVYRSGEALAHDLRRSSTRGSAIVPTTTSSLRSAGCAQRSAALSS
jgi:Thiamine pyrophosphate enzyme, C-terminal TPP binding domain